jgi:hypothetical protein
VSLYDAFVGAESDPETLACVRSSITEDELRELVIEEMIGGERSDSNLYDRMASCSAPEEDPALPTPTTAVTAPGATRPNGG